MTRKNKTTGPRSICPLTSSKRKRDTANKLALAVKKRLPPGLAQPALRALAAAGYSSLDKIAKVAEADLAKLHGIGPNAIKLIREALKSRGESFLP